MDNTKANRDFIKARAKELTEQARRAALYPEMLATLKLIQNWLLFEKPITDDGTWNQQFVKANNLTQSIITKCEGKLTKEREI